MNDQPEFNSLIPLHEESGWKTCEMQKLAPTLNQGWAELATLNASDRLNFTREFWVLRLKPNLDEERRLDRFFEAVDEVGIFLVQEREGSPFEVRMIYSGQDIHVHGSPPAAEQEILSLQQFVHPHPLPATYLDFLTIHNGFGAFVDRGVLQARSVQTIALKLSEQLEGELFVGSGGQMILPGDLIPFYEGEALGQYQCFYLPWSPKGEVGNVLLSLTGPWMSTLEGKRSFPTFFEWLLHYLEEGPR